MLKKLAKFIFPNTLYKSAKQPQMGLIIKWHFNYRNKVLKAA